MNHSPRVSVLMPTYNQVAFIRRALDSLCCQTLADWELLLVDDGCTDETPAAIAPYLANERIHYQRLPSNQGRGVALNVALEQARALRGLYLVMAWLCLEEAGVGAVAGAGYLPDRPVCPLDIPGHCRLN